MELGSCRTLTIHEAVGVTAFYEKYDILDEESGQMLAQAIEQVDAVGKFLKLFLDTSWLPRRVSVTDPSGMPLFELFSRGGPWGQTFSARHRDGRVIAVFRHEFSCFGARLSLRDAQGQALGCLCGDWKKRHFVLENVKGTMVASIDHLFTHYSRELFTTADDYRIELKEDISWNLIALAGALIIDLLFHED